MDSGHPLRDGLSSQATEPVVSAVPASIPDAVESCPSCGALPCDWVNNPFLDEFVQRFKARMLAVAGPTFDDGGSIADYADDTAPTYWEEPWQREIGPEECADADMSYWGEE